MGDIRHLAREHFECQVGFDDSWALLLFHHLHGFRRETVHLDPGFQSLKRKILLTNWLRCLWSVPAKNWSSNSPDNSKKGTWRKKHKRINPLKEMNWKWVFGFSHPLLKAGCFGSLQVNVVHYVPDHLLSIDHICMYKFISTIIIIIIIIIIVVIFINHQIVRSPVSMWCHTWGRRQSTHRLPSPWSIFVKKLPQNWDCLSDCLTVYR